MIVCHKCGSRKVKHYRQIRKDGEAVVTARCENGHIPEKGKPFYPKWQFNVATLPPLSSFDNDEQPELFQTAAKLPRVKKIEIPQTAAPKYPRPTQKPLGKWDKNFPQEVK